MGAAASAATARRDAKAIAEEIENVGGFMNAHTGREQTAYYVKCLKQDFDLALDILADIFLNSTCDPAEFERERGGQQEAAALDPGQHLRAVWPDQIRHLHHRRAPGWAVHAHMLRTCAPACRRR